MPNKIKEFYEFEDFRLDTENPSLWRGNELVSIPPKALETLILLVKQQGEIVSREELLENIWRATFVEESNINYTISLIRKTLGEKDLIQTVPRRGYSFVADVKKVSENEQFSVSQTQSLPIPPKRFPWVLVTTVLISLLFVTSFAFWWRTENKPASIPNNSEAMQAYTRGKMILETKNAAKREEKAIDEFQKAITLDPTFALAYVGLGEGFTALSIKESYPISRDYQAKARTAVEKALTLDANLAEAYFLRGWLKRNADWDFTGAENDLRRGIDLNPKNAIAHYRLAYVMISLGKFDEALAEINRSNELDPISDFVQAGRFPILEARGEYDEALKLAEDFWRENKENTNAQRAVATFYYHKKDFAKVIELAQKMLEKDSAKNASFAWLSLISTAYRQTNQPEKADQSLQKLEELAQSDTKVMYSLAMNYAEIKRIDEAINILQKCFEMCEERMVWLNTEPRFVNLRSDSRFKELLQKMKLQ